ncbi:MAG: phosphotransferase [Verrucomicrobia bacterium]|nr:phosphotransferase [Verrucomicrobiota bacterium]
MSIKTPKKAFLLAAGYGTRMLPLSRDLPKPLMPLWGRPLIDHTLSLLASWGVREVLVNCHHDAAQIITHLLAADVSGLRVSISHEPDILGTGGALRKAEWFVAGDEPFWLLNADLAIDVDPGAFVRSYEKGRSLAVLWLHPVKGPRTVEMKRGRITDFRSEGAGADGTYTFCGLHLLSPRILKFLSRDGFASIVPAYERAIKSGEKIEGLTIEDSYWADLGTPEQYLETHRETRRQYRAGKRGGRLFVPSMSERLAELRKKGVTVQGCVTVGRGVTVGSGAFLRDVVLWDGAAVGRGLRVENAIVGRSARIRLPADHIVLPANRLLRSLEVAALESKGWDIDAATAYVLPARGSARAYYRVEDGRHRALLMRYSGERFENTLFVRHARFLKHLGVRVPEVLADSSSPGFCLLEDLGARSLLDVVKCGAPERRVRALYEAVIAQLAVLHDKGRTRAKRSRLPLVPCFDAVLYRWERELFRDHFLSGLGDDALAVAVMKELSRVGRAMVRMPPVLIHRDLQSSNVLIPKRGVPAFIDFQGMRFGPAAYDLASLLCDPYVMLKESLQLDLLDAYNASARSSVEAETFWTAAVQRLAQAIGAYGRLSSLPGCSRFAAHIPGGLSMLARAARKAGDCPHIEMLSGLFLRRSS